MRISGIQKFTQLDFPGRIACILFTAGCNFRCGYCHNPEFVLPEKIEKIKDTFISKEAVFNFLQKREELLDGIVISGGEPTMMEDLLEFIEEIKDKFDYEVKLDSNGNKPKVLKEAIDRNLVDYIAVDIKTDFDNYFELAGGSVDPDKIKESIELLMNSNIEYEFRSTIIKGVHTEENFKNMAEMIEGADIMYLQKYNSGHTLDPSFARYESFSDREHEEIAKIFEQTVQEVKIRN
ncbi:MAG: anaerobic ribonucleoside-triphosphate reductase activating protein [Candidatus Magasanikbacteria bacterium]